MEAPVRAGPGDRAVRLEMDVLHAGGGIDALMHDIGGGEPLRCAADLTVDVDVHISVRGDPLVVQQRRFRAHRGLRVEHGGQNFVLHLDQSAGCFGRGFGFCDNRSDALPYKADHMVEYVGVVGINQVIFMSGGAVEAPRHVFPSENGDNARHGGCLLAPDAENSRVRMR